MTEPTVKELIEKGIIEQFKDKLFATCQKCDKSWQLRFDRISKECNLCKCQNWWKNPGKRGPKKK